MDMFARAKGNATKVGSTATVVRNSGHIPYYHSGLLRAHFLPTTFLEMQIV